MTGKSPRLRSRDRGQCNLGHNRTLTSGLRKTIVATEVDVNIRNRMKAALMNTLRHPPAPLSFKGRRNPSSCGVPFTILWVAMGAAPLLAVDSFEQPPISYSESRPANAIEELNDRLGSGGARLVFDHSLGYLRSVLDLLQVPISSQTLVFSKTSLQQRHISPRNPRAIYFNDEVYVGFVRGGDVLELSVADPQLGTVFYTLDQAIRERPTFVRQTNDCLICHGGSQTRDVPGHIVRSVYADRSGQPIFSAGSHRVDDTTPLADRWGGWYVSGRHGDATHLGNVTYRKRPEEGDERDTTGLNQSDVSPRFDSSGYLTPHSDLVALSVLAHQTAAHTILAKASFEARMAIHREAALNRELGEPADHRWPSTNTILDSAATSLIDCFLFSGAPALPAPIEGTTTFADEFVKRGPADGQGRSLRSLDLKNRLFRHPCSFLIYSKSFDSLPEEVRRRFWEKMKAVLQGKDTSGKYAHLFPAERSAICDILVATKPEAARDLAPTVIQP